MNATSRIEVLHGSHIAWQEQRKMFCIRKNICSHRKKNLLFLPCNMAAVQNLYWTSVGVLLTSNGRVNFSVSE